MRFWDAILGLLSIRNQQRFQAVTWPELSNELSNFGAAEWTSDVQRRKRAAKTD